MSSLKGKNFSMSKFFSFFFSELIPMDVCVCVGGGGGGD